MKTRRARRYVSMLLIMAMVLTIFTGAATPAFAAETAADAGTAVAAVQEPDAGSTVESVPEGEEEKEEPQEEKKEEEAGEGASKEDAAAEQAEPAKEEAAREDAAADTSADAPVQDDSAQEEVVAAEEPISDSTQDQALSDGEVSSNLADHIKTLEIIGDPDSVASGHNLTVKFGWLIEGAVHGGSDTFTYQLPVNFGIQAASTGPITRGEGGRRIGTYRVDRNGLVTISYFSDYNTENQTTINYMEVTGTAEYNPDDNEHTIEFVWKDGSKVVVVENSGDFSVEKEVARKWKGDALSDFSTLEYTVTVSSEQGTREGFTIADTITIAETYGSGTAFKSVKLDPDSFAITKGGSPVTGWSVDAQTRNFTITGLPALGAGETYTLTYNVDVERTRTTSIRATGFGYVRNNATVTSGEDSASAKTETYYSAILIKDANDPLSATRGRQWQIRIMANGTDLTGFVVKDVSQHPITDRVVLVGYDSKSKEIARVTYENDFTGKTEFEITLPNSNIDGNLVNEWRLYYYTNVTEEEQNSTVETSNTTYLYGNDEKWEVTRKSTIGMGGVTLSGPVKTYTGYTQNETSEKLLNLNWKLDITYSNTPGKSVSFTDTIRNPERSAVDQWGNNSSSDAVFPEGHYAYATELYAELTDAANGLHIVTGDGVDLSYREAVNAGYTINMLFYPNASVTSGETRIENTDSTSHVRRIQFTVTAPEGQEKISLSRIYINNYHTIFDTGRMNPGYVWRVYNRLSADGVDSIAYGRFEKEGGSLSKQVRKINSLNADGTVASSVYVSDDAELDYDLQGGKLRYRLLVSVPSDQTSITVTDLIPAGLTLADNAGGDIAWGENLWVGLYTTSNGIIKADSYSYANWSWTDARRRANISVSQQAEGDATRLTVTVNNLGSELTFMNNNRYVCIQYEVDLPEDLGAMGDTVETEDGFVSSKTFRNVAEFDGTTSSLDAVVKQTSKILDKTGEQIEDDGAYTKTVHYTVEVNPNALDLIDGSDSLTLTDTMTSKELDFKLDPTSIKLYYANGTEVDPLAIRIEQPETVDGVTTQVFTISVEDATAYRLEYDFIADKREATSAATEGDFVNEIALKGQVSDTDTTLVRGINVRATSNHAGLTLVKVDENNNAKFLSAKFKLEKYNGSSYETVPGYGSFTIAGQEGLVFDYYSENCPLEGNVLYRLTEVEAPEDYQLDETPFYFIIKGNIQDVRSGDIAMTDLVVASDEEALAAAGAPTGLEIKMLEPNTGSYYEITNERAPASGKVVLKADKTLTGRDLKAGEFSFIVKEGDDVVATGTNAADGSITFSEIKYTMDDLGTHTYTVTENSGKLGGIEYDDASYEVIVTVTDNETKNLVVETSYPEGGIHFANTYEASGAVKLEANKTLTGRDLVDGEFSFSIEEDGELISTGTNDADGLVEFPQINYTLEDVGEHTYVITEDAGQLGGVTYDDASFTVTVEVTDNGRGTLVAVPTYPEGGVEFTNTYAANGEVELTAKKTLEGRDLAADEFSFTVKEGDSVVATGSNDADGNVTFGKIGYSLSDVGTHTYVIEEEAGRLGGVTYDDASFTVTVVVANAGDGTLTTTVTYPEGGVEFTNSYAASGEAELTAKKTLEGRALNDGEFSFTVMEGDKVVSTGNNDADGNIAFDKIAYTLEDVGTHTYVITEDAGRLGGVTYDDSSYTVNVKVSDNGDGTLAADITYPENGVVFGNKYEAEGEVVLTAKKTLEGRALNDGEFSFTVKEGDEAVADGVNDENGNIIFSSIEYTLEDLGEHTYVITEDAGRLGGVTYDEKSIEVTVTVSDNGDGTLAAVAVYTDENAGFVNKYDTEPVKLTLEGTKELTGRDLKDGEFTFSVMEDDEVVAAGTNDRNGKIVFTEIEYKLADVGTHTLLVTEDRGDKGGVEYSNETYTVTVNVSDNGDGTLTVQAQIPESGLVFHNGYSSTEAVVTLAAKKNLTGATLKSGQFSFELKDADGRVVETVKNAADGRISFSDLHFTEAGEYSYTISEVKGSDSRVTYDTTVYTVKITVTDDGEGRLIARVDAAGRDLVFNNKYTSKKTTTTTTTRRSRSAKTGDSANVVLWISLMGAAIAGLAAFIFRRRMNK